jgi:hypothetical protein
MLQPEPGIYRNVTFAEYIGWPHVNNSSLSYAARSMAHYRYAPEIETTDAMRFGSLVHCGKLEPASIGARYAVMPDFAAEIRKPDGTEYSNVRATKAYKEAADAWRATIGDRECCTSQDLEQMLGIVQSLVMHDQARLWLCGGGEPEVSFVWDDPDSGVRCKARVDRWHGCNGQQLAVDLKTTKDASDFERSILRYAYHRQAAFYTDGITACTGIRNVLFGIVAVEKEKPFGVRAALMSDDAVAVGRREYKRLLAQLAECREANVWPGYSDPVAWSLPSWALAAGDDVDITVNGEALEL